MLIKNSIEVSPKDIKELLIKGWMTHDGMWFHYCVKECGIEKTNKINKAAIRAMAKIELNRIKKLFNVKKIESFEDLKDFITIIFAIVKGSFMDFSIHYQSNNVLLFEMHKCFAHDGISKIGVIDKYECGIVERIDTWFKELGLKFEAIPKFDTCQLFKEEKCIRKYTFYFD